MKVYVNGRAVRLQPRRAIGKGGEADVYDIGGGRALKLFKPPEHPDFVPYPDQAKAARLRIDEQQRKLPDFPRHLDPRVVAPQDLVRDRADRKTLGYTMRRIGDPTPLALFGAGAFRRQGVAAAEVVEVFRNLHDAVTRLHADGVVIGDFNDLNVLVTDVGSSPEVWLIDADSYQFGVYPCRLYSERFVDPLLCNGALQLARSHNTDSDWYAFTVMLLRSLLLTDPYGGVYKPQDPGRKVPAPLRPLHRVTVFHPQVRYPKPAHPREILPDDWLDHFDQVFHHDARGPYPARLFDLLKWTTCATCRLEHSRRACPRCRRQLAMAPALRTVRGRLECTVVLRADGPVVAVAVGAAGLAWLTHEAGAYRRENGETVLEGGRSPELTFGLLGSSTLVARRDQLAVLGPDGARQLSVETTGGASAFASNGHHLFRIENGRLLRDEPLAPVLVGEVLSEQTRFWVGESFGFGYYRAGRLAVAFVFEAEGTGLNDGVRLPPLPSQWLDATCTFAGERCWLLITARETGRTRRHAVVLRRDGSVEATGGGDAHDLPWLASLRGACASDAGLLVPTDDGVVRIGIAGSDLLEAETFPDTEPYVDASSRLLASPEGLIVVGETEIRRLVVRHKK